MTFVCDVSSVVRSCIWCGSLVLGVGGVSFNHNSVKIDETEEAGCVVDSHPSWVPDQGNKVSRPQGGGGGSSANSDFVNSPLTGRRERVYLLPVTRRLVRAWGWLIFGRYGNSDMPRGCVSVWMTSYWCEFHWQASIIFAKGTFKFNYLSVRVMALACQIRFFIWKGKFISWFMIAMACGLQCKKFFTGIFISFGKRWSHKTHFFYKALNPFVYKRTILSTGFPLFKDRFKKLWLPASLHTLILTIKLV